MNIHTISAPLDKLFQAAASELILWLKGRETKSTVIGLCGGKSVVGFLNALRSQNLDHLKILLKNVNFFMVDERMVPLDSPDSNFKLLNEELFSSLLKEGVLIDSQIHPFVINNNQSDKGVLAYSRKLEEFGGILDCVILGVGRDAHVASLFPNHPALESNEELYIAISDSPKPPSERLTAAPKLIQKSELVLTVFIGESKKQAYEKFKDNKSVTKDCPAKFAVGAKKCIVITDLN